MHPIFPYVLFIACAGSNDGKGSKAGREEIESKIQALDLQNDLIADAEEKPFS